MTRTRSLSSKISLSGEEAGIVTGPGWHDKDNFGCSGSLEDRGTTLPVCSQRKGWLSLSLKGESEFYWLGNGRSEEVTP